MPDGILYGMMNGKFMKVKILSNLLRILKILTSV